MDRSTGTSAAVVTKSVFTDYWRAVERLLNAKPRRKETAIKLSSGPPEGCDPATLVSALRQSLDGPWWLDPVAKERKSNWLWRHNVPKDSNSSREIELERQIVTRSGTSGWTCQLSTTSGLLRPHSDKRRAIDLACRIEPNAYRFIELKVKSDNPLYATFEVLGYGLAYCLARHYGFGGTGEHNVMEASHIVLEVLAPECWYEYKHRGDADRSRFDLSWLAAAINIGLATEIKALRLDGIDDIAFAFRTFSSGKNIDAAAAEIISTASCR